MDPNEILTGVVGSSPFAGFLIWYIITERKSKKEVLHEMKEIYSECQKKNAEREDKVFDVLMATHTLMEKTQDVMIGLSNKYDMLNKAMEKGFAETNAELKNIYRNCTSGRCGGGGSP